MPTHDDADDWIDLGALEALRATPLQQLTVGRTKLALSYRDGEFAAISGVCNHAGGPLGDGTLEGDYVVCPWHGWKFHRLTGAGEPGFEADQVPRYELREDGGRLWARRTPIVARKKAPHPKHPLDRPLDRAPGGLRVLGISTTSMDLVRPRYSTSDALLTTALDHAAAAGRETRLIRLRDLSFRHCEGYYSKSAQACTWPCSITQMDPTDQMDQVYEAFVFWADVVVIALPIRWGVASSLYFKMAERLNCVQNQITIRDRVMLKRKVASFIITGGQDNVQGVAGQALTFFSELGCQFPQFPYIAHSRGWSAEDMENNVAYVKASTELHEAARELVDRACDRARQVVGDADDRDMVRAGRKGRRAAGARRRVSAARRRHTAVAS
jgi:nitrite reductase/ring-hydroxylating ferredoxin subunit/multimeric flavodoxin WrbA